MTSIFENTTSKVTIHILHDDTLTKDNRDKFIRTAEKYSQGLELHDVTEYRNKIGRNIEEHFRNQFTIGALYRLAMQDILSIDKVIYLDCDILVNLDIMDLWNVEIEDNCIAGVLDEGIQKQRLFSFNRIRFRLNGCRASTYINSGVLVMNLKKIRESGDFFTTSILWLKHHLHSAQYPDQDVLNTLFYGRIKLIDKKFNRHTELDADDLSNIIIHTIWQKPWKRIADTCPDRIYWDMLTKSAWGESISSTELISIMLGIAGNGKKANILLSQASYFRLVKRIARLTLNKLKISELYRITKLLIIDTYYRIKYRFSRS